jgi:hypothetical protein
MKNTEPQRDRFESAARHGAHNEGIGDGFAEAVDMQSGITSRYYCATLQAHWHRFDASRRKRANKLSRMPVPAIDHEADD